MGAVCRNKDPRLFLIRQLCKRDDDIGIPPKQSFKDSFWWISAEAIFCCPSQRVSVLSSHTVETAGIEMAITGNRELGFDSGEEA